MEKKKFWEANKLTTCQLAITNPGVTWHQNLLQQNNKATVTLLNALLFNVNVGCFMLSKQMARTVCLIRLLWLWYVLIVCVFKGKDERMNLTVVIHVSTSFLSLLHEWLRILKAVLAEGIRIPAYIRMCINVCALGDRGWLGSDTFKPGFPLLLLLSELI